MKNIVRQLRRNQEISQHELANSIGVSRHTIIGIEKGEQEPSVTVALNIAKFFKMDPREIFFTPDVNSIQQETHG